MRTGPEIPFRVILVLATMLGGCTPQDAAVAASQTSRSDSAGILVVTSAQVNDRVVSLPTPADSFFTDDTGAPFIFTSIGATVARTTPEGITFVVSSQDATIYVFDESGRYRRNIGRRGDGPGEMRLPYSVRIFHDTIVVYDPMRLALLRWADGGQQLLPQFNVEDSDQGTTPFAFRQDKLLALRHSVAGDSSVASLSWSADSTSLLEFRYPVGVVLPLPCVPIPMRRRPLLSPTVHESSYDRRVVVSGDAEYVVWVLEDDVVTMSVRRSISPRPVDRRSIELAAGPGLRASLGGSRCSISPTDLAKLVGAASVVPAIHGLSLTSDMSLWVKRTLRGERPSLVDQFDETGAYVRTLRNAELPIGVLPDGRLLIPVEDEDSGGMVVALVRPPT